METGIFIMSIATLIAGKISIAYGVIEDKERSKMAGEFLFVVGVIEFVLGEVFYF